MDETLDLQALDTEVNGLLQALESPAAASTSEAVSFGLEEAPLSGPRSRLEQLAAEARQSAPSALSFGVEEESPAAPEGSELQTFLEHLRQEISLLAQVQTPAASTRMRWDGDTLTALRSDWQPQQAQAHLQTLDRHLRRKLLALRLLTLLAAMLTRVTLLTGLTGPLAWLTAYRMLKDASALWREAAQAFL